MESKRAMVAIVGRPNVGKSTLFNRLIGQRRAIVGDEPGITRDRIYGEVEWAGAKFSLVDTGGIVPDDDAVIPANIFKQAGKAIKESQLLIWVVDARRGVTQLDEELASLLRETGKPVFVAANKIDSSSLESESTEFYQFGFEDVYAVSAEQGIGIGELLDGTVALLKSEPAIDADEAEPRELNLAIVGRPNVGKSSLLNQLLGEDRVIVSPVAGTTRDAIDTVEGVTALDANIAGYAVDAGCSIIIAVNKWDALAEKETNTAVEFERSLRDKMKFLEWAPVITISALTGQRVERILPLVVRADEARNRRISTSQLNDFFERAIAQPRGGTAPTPDRKSVV